MIFTLRRSRQTAGSASVATLAVTLIVGLWPTLPLASTIAAPSFSEILNESSLIFRGRTLHSSSDWRLASGGRVIVTLVTFAVERVLKGEASRVIELEFLGGSVGGVMMHVAAIPVFAVGDRDVLFVNPRGRPVSPLVGIMFGRFRIEQDAYGREWVKAFDGTPFDRVEEIGAHISTRARFTRGMALGEFEAQVLSTLRQQAR